jgi:Holliday junction resolvase RusA-like endonuclease
MTMQVCFTVEGEPKGKGRPRFRRTKNFVQTYTDAKTKSYEQQIKDAATRAMGESEPLETPLSVFLYVRFSVPKSYSKQRTKDCLSGKEKHTKKPDVDNVAKQILDSMNNVVYKDDVQVIFLNVKKLYSAVPGVDILVREELE